MEDCKFRVEFLEEAKEFLEGLDEKAIRTCRVIKRNVF